MQGFKSKLALSFFNLQEVHCIFSPTGCTRQLDPDAGVGRSDIAAVCFAMSCRANQLHLTRFERSSELTFEQQYSKKRLPPV